MSKKENYITVTELNNIIKDTLMENFSSQFKVKGEISNIKASGPHTYLTLKDDNSSVSVTIWNAKPNVKNGDDVMVFGKLMCYTKQGTYNINANKIDRIGMGLLHETLEKQRKLFEEKGYFIKSMQRTPLPDKINRVGILTAIEGAALQDILYVLKKNMFYGEVHVKNCAVQGQNCPTSISNGIDYFNELHKTKPFDILIVARGGGSFEDLIGYSSKEVVKAIYNTNIYTMSAVGHEVDTMLSDYSANYRAPTPSIAGEVISSIQRKKKEMIVTNLEQLSMLKLQIKTKIIKYEDSVKNNMKILKTIDPVSFLDNEIHRLSRIKLDFKSKISNSIEKKIDLIQKFVAKNESYDPSQIFENGYVAIVDEDNNLINTVVDFNSKVNSKNKLKLVFVDGEIDLDSMFGQLYKSDKTTKVGKN